MIVTFVRHGQSTANLGLPCEDHTKVELTSLGYEQAQQLAARWTRRPDRILLSPFLRTHLTAAPTRERFPTVPVDVIPMEEFTYLEPSRWHNSSPADRLPYVRAYWDAMDPKYVDGPGAESFAMLVTRVSQVLALLEALRDSWCIAFSHGQFMQTVKVLLEHPEVPLQLQMQLLFVERLFDNTECFTIELVQRNWLVRDRVPTASPLGCDHANEVPACCFCPGDCYCKAFTCRG